MRLLFTFAFIVFFAPGLSAQRIHFSDTTNVWRVVHFDVDYFNTGYSYNYGHDTIIGSQTYRLLKGNFGAFSTALAVREDTAVKKVFCHFVTDYLRADSTDNLEHVLYDYTLKVNDTFRFDKGSKHYASVVNSLDSVLIGNSYYKRWGFYDVYVGNAFPSKMGIIIEGIGSVNYPAWPAAYWIFEDGYQLQCFSNKGTQPPCTPSTNLPYDQPPFGAPPSFGPPLTQTFDNNTSCSLDVKNIPGDQNSFKEVPTPGGKEMVLQFPYTIKAGGIQLYNSTGRPLQYIPFTNCSKLNIGRFIAIDGLYFYTLTDYTHTTNYKGKLLFQNGR